MKSKQKKIRDRHQIISEKSADRESEQNNGVKGKKSGYIEIFFGVLILLMGIWLYCQTWGLRLLSVDVWIGRISKYHGVFLLIGCACFMIGFWSVMHAAKLSENNTKSNTAKKKPAQTECPICGKMNDSGNKFCTFCGSRMQERD